MCIFPIFVDGTSCANECQRNRRERLVTFRNPKEWNEHLPNFFHLTSPRSRGRRIIFFHRRSRYVTRCKIHTSYTHCTARKYLLVITSLKVATKLRGAGGRVGDYQSPSAARGLRYRKYAFVHVGYPRKGLPPAVRLSVCLSVCYDAN